MSNIASQLRPRAENQGFRVGIQYILLDETKPGCFISENKMGALILFF